MSIRIVKGNLFSSTANVIAHGVNCRGAFGSGVAGQIRKRWPEVYRAYLTKHTDDGWVLGDLQVVDLEGSNQKIANLATQQGYGYTNNVYVDYKALRLSMAKLFKHCHDCGYSIAMPKIGAGLAGGDWTTIYGIISEEAEKYPDLDIKIYALELEPKDFKLI
jgi:O-acetyl-ADP-ribose deacetylase (regulator of RNase III)